MIKKSKTIESSTIKVDVNFGIALKTLRKQNNLTQKDVAKFLNISTTSYSRYEQDLREPDYKTLAMLSVLFDVSMGDFFINAIVYKQHFKEEYETRLNEKHIDFYDYTEQIVSIYYSKYRIEKRAIKLIARVNTILRGERAIPGEIEYLENHLKDSFKDYQAINNDINELSEYKKIDDEIISVLNKIQTFNDKL
jgi:transcriptional regulator with XRE-family HTH domain